MALGLVNLSLGQDNNTKAFMDYVSKFNKVYSSMEEFEMRLSMFNKVEDQIRDHE
jgi:hypothetical protein